MDNRVITIPGVDGNSKLGVPVFSAHGRKSNYKYSYFQQSFAEKQEILSRQKPLTQQQVEIKRYQQYRESVPSQRVQIEGMLRQLALDDGAADQELKQIKAETTVKEDKENRKQGETQCTTTCGPSTEIRSQSGGTAGFKTVPRSKMSQKDSVSKGGGAFSRAIYDQVEKRIHSAYIKKDPETTSTALQKAKAIKQRNFENAHVCAKLLKAHDEIQLSYNRQAYYTDYSQLREQMKAQRGELQENSMVPATERGVSTGQDLVTVDQKPPQESEQAIPVNLRVKSESKIIGGGPNLHAMSSETKSRSRRTQQQQRTLSQTDDYNSKSDAQRIWSATTGGREASTNIKQRNGAVRPASSAVFQRGSKATRCMSGSGRHRRKGNSLLFSSDCLNMQISQAHTLIKNFPDQEIILHDPDRVTQQKCRRLGAEQIETSCKLLDFEIHLSKRARKGLRGELTTAASGPGREFINVDELIQAQINEGCHGRDNLASSYQEPLIARGASTKSPTTNCQSTNSLGMRPFIKENFFKKQTVALAQPFQAGAKQNDRYGFKKQRVTSAAHLGGITSSQVELQIPSASQIQYVGTNFALPGVMAGSVPQFATTRRTDSVFELEKEGTPSGKILNQIDKSSQRLLRRVPLVDVPISHQSKRGETYSTQIASGAEVLNRNSQSDTATMVIDEDTIEELPVVTSSASPDIDHAPQPSVGPVQDQQPIGKNIIFNQTRLHTLIQKVHGAIEFSKQVSRTKVPLQDRFFEMEDEEFSSGIPRQQKASQIKFGFTQPLYPAHEFTKPKLATGLISFRKQTTRVNCHQKNAIQEIKFCKETKKNQAKMFSHETKDLFEQRKHLGNSLNEPQVNSRFLSFKRTGPRDRHIDAKSQTRVTRDGRRVQKGSHPGPDNIRLTERYQNILRDNQKDDYMRHFCHTPRK